MTMKDPKSYDLLSYIVVFLGFYEGVLPFVAKSTDWEPFLSLPRHLSSPAWWIVSGLVIVASFFSLWGIDIAKKRRHPDA
ncbi:hypothetical protein [Spirillospora sp. CA-294931]|uniref:hypothetical protein n=1 Tax=Spirillospora sp. CA-294931 TaxID=3240042 RepID=UPI003D8CEFCA